MENFSPNNQDNKEPEKEPGINSTQGELERSGVVGKALDKLAPTQKQIEEALRKKRKANRRGKAGDAQLTQEPLPRVDLRDTDSARSTEISEQTEPSPQEVVSQKRETAGRLFDLSEKIKDAPELYKIAYDAAQAMYPVPDNAPAWLKKKYQSAWINTSKPDWGFIGPNGKPGVSKPVTGKYEGIWAKVANEMINKSLLGEKEDTVESGTELRIENGVAKGRKATLEKYYGKWGIKDIPADKSAVEILRENKDRIIKERVDAYKKKLTRDDKGNIDATTLFDLRARLEKEIQTKIKNWTEMGENRTPNEAGFITDPEKFIQNADLDREWALNTPLYNEIKTRLLNTAKREVQGALDKAKAYNEQDTLIVAEENKDVEAYKRFIEEAVTLRAWRENLKPFGPIELYVFDFLNGGRLKHRIQEGGKNSEAKAVDSSFGKELSSIDTQLQDVKAIIGTYRAIPTDPINNEAISLNGILSLYNGARPGFNEFLSATVGGTALTEEEAWRRGVINNTVKNWDANKVFMTDKNFVKYLKGNLHDQRRAKNSLREWVDESVREQVRVSSFQNSGAELSEPAIARLIESFTEELFVSLQMRAQENPGDASSGRLAA